MPSFRTPWCVFIVLLALLVLQLGRPATVFSQVDSVDAAVPIDGGVLVDEQAGVAYVMTGDGGIEAINLQDGTTSWTSTGAAKPLALVGSLLVVQLDSPDDPSAFHIASLDTREEGAMVISRRLSLGDGVRAAIDDAPGQSFKTSVRVENGVVHVSWVLIRNEITGIAPDSESARSDGKGDDTAPTILNGTIGFNTATAELVTLPPEDPSRTLRGPRLDLDESERLRDAAGLQFRSADDRHIIASERVSDDRDFEKYRWSVYDRATGELVGSVQSHLSIARVVIQGDVLLMVTDPYVIRLDGKLTEEPKQLRAIDVSSGARIWSKEVRDTTFRGPYPP